MTDNAVIGVSTSRIIIIMESLILLEATNLPVDIIKTLMSTLTLYKTDRNGFTHKSVKNLAKHSILASLSIG